MGELGGGLAFLLVLVGITMFILAILMPYFVYRIHHHVKTIQWQMKELLHIFRDVTSK